MCIRHVDKSPLEYFHYFLLVELFLAQKDAKNNHVLQILIPVFLLDRTCQLQPVFSSALFYCLLDLSKRGVLTGSSSISSSTIFVSKSSIPYFIDSPSFSWPFCINTSLANSQYAVAKDFLPLLLAGMIRSNLEVTLSVFDKPITGIPAFVASKTACVSVCGSETTTSCGSI